MREQIHKNKYFSCNVNDAESERLREIQIIRTNAEVLILNGVDILSPEIGNWSHGVLIFPL